MQFGGAPRRGERGPRLVERETSLSDTGQGIDFDGDELTAARELLSALEMAQRGNRVTFE